MDNLLEKIVYSDELPRCPTTPRMRQQMEALKKRSGLSMSELQRRAIVLFLERTTEISVDQSTDSEALQG